MRLSNGRWSKKCCSPGCILLLWLLLKCMPTYSLSLSFALSRVAHYSVLLATYTCVYCSQQPATGAWPCGMSCLISSTREQRRDDIQTFDPHSVFCPFWAGFSVLSRVAGWSALSCLTIQWSSDSSGLFFNWHRSNQRPNSQRRKCRAFKSAAVRPESREHHQNCRLKAPNTSAWRDYCFSQHIIIIRTSVCMWTCSYRAKCNSSVTARTPYHR
jgi:hypothetical protein